MAAASVGLALKACYSVGELARAMGLSRWQTYRLLKARAIPLDRTEGVNRIWLSALQRCAPDAWESLVLIESMRAGR